jgi:uncharacterized membrane protein YedE/YeeE
VNGRTLAVALLCGALFGFGLARSTMLSPEVILSFLNWKDFGLLLVLGGAVVVTFAAYRFAPRLLRRPLLGGEFGKYKSTLNRRTLLGAAIFGVGWGLCGVCPGPAIAGIGAGNFPVLAALAAILAGAFIHGKFVGK